jgi:hypothetical protein
MFQLNGSPISIDNEYTTEDGVTYPHLRDPAVREALGVIEVADDPWYDQRFYWGVDNPKDLDQLKTQWIAQTKQTANATLAQTDWMVIRKAERNIDIPEDVATARAAAIQEANDKEAAITAATTVEELMTALGFVPTEAPAPVVEEVVLAEEPAPAMTSEQISAL